MICGTTKVIAHLGYPTETFKSPMICNPYFEKQGIDVVAVPMGVKAEDYAQVLPALFRLTNIHGAIITMPHKITTVAFLDEVSTTVKITESCNAIIRRPDGSWYGEMFDGIGFIRSVERKDQQLNGARVLVSGCGGVGSAIAASLATTGIATLSLFDIDAAKAAALQQRLHQHYPALVITLGSNNPAGHDIVVNATPLGMQENDPLPFDVEQIAADTFVADVVMKQEFTPLLQAARAKGCDIQIGTDMLFEQIPAYFEFFGLGTATVAELREIANISY